MELNRATKPAALPGFVAQVPPHPARAVACRGPWLFSPAVDAAMFGLPVLVALVLVGLRPGGAWPADETPPWAWLGVVLLVDVAHVWGTLFRVYTRKKEFWRRPRLYIGVPAVCYILAAALYQYDFVFFWRAIAYAATWHFVRQQVGWVRLYGRRGGPQPRWHAWLDQATVYGATLYPLVWWHTRLPHNFAWMLQGDFVALPGGLETVAARLFVAVLSLYVGRMAVLAWHGRMCLGRDMVVAGTLVCWYVGIVMFDSDYVFTVTNVLIHGVPYMVLVHLYRRNAAQIPTASAGGGFTRLLAALGALAFCEECLWDHTLWHERAWLFGEGLDLSAMAPWLVPLLALPQLTHYVLDGFVWRRAANPSLQGLFK